MNMKKITVLFAFIFCFLAGKSQEVIVGAACTDE